MAEEEREMGSYLEEDSMEGSSGLLIPSEGRLGRLRGPHSLCIR